MHRVITISFLLFVFLIDLGVAKEKDFIIHRIASPYQADSTNIWVLLPDNIEAGQSYKVLYILPVVDEANRRFGSGLEEVMKYNYHNTCNLICIAPEFTSKPWYCDHSSDMGKQDESHFLKTVIPFIDAHYPSLKSTEGRLLMGFSKSGRGAFSLILRNPEVIHKAAGWDCGILVDTGPIAEEDRAERIERIFGTVSNFDSYRINTLIKERGVALGKESRIFLYSTEGKRAIGCAKLHSLMVELKIPHRYLFEPHRPHRWDSGWIPEAVRFLVDDDNNLVR